jgi:hypothetical protein
MDDVISGDLRLFFKSEVLAISVALFDTGVELILRLDLSGLIVRVFELDKGSYGGYFYALGIYAATER